jgi:hypothetical protein
LCACDKDEDEISRERTFESPAYPRLGQGLLPENEILMLDNQWLRTLSGPGYGRATEAPA